MCLNQPDLNGAGEKENRAGKLRAPRAFVIAVISLLAWAGPTRAGMVYLPNGSFESPTTVFADTRVDNWQKSPKPFWYDESGGFYWDQLAGLFVNTPPGDSAHIDNCDGNQAVFLFAVPQVALFQDFNSTDWANSTPSHAFDARFEVGKSYTLTVGVIGGGGNMTNGATMELSLYYRDGASNMVAVAATAITNSVAVFSNTTHLVDFQVHLPAVKASDPWAGQNIGVQLLSTVSPDLAGGYWDLDNVRLSEVREPALAGLIHTNGQSQFLMQSEPGLRFEILAATNVSLAISNWSSLGILTNTSGITAFFDNAAGVNARFYQARQLP